MPPWRGVTNKGGHEGLRCLRCWCPPQAGPGIRMCACTFRIHTIAIGTRCTCMYITTAAHISTCVCKWCGHSPCDRLAVNVVAIPSSDEASSERDIDGAVPAVCAGRVNFASSQASSIVNGPSVAGDSLVSIEQGSQYGQVALSTTKIANEQALPVLLAL